MSSKTLLLAAAALSTVAATSASALTYLGVSYTEVDVSNVAASQGTTTGGNTVFVFDVSTAVASLFNADVAQGGSNGTFVWGAAVSGYGLVDGTFNGSGYELTKPPTWPDAFSAGSFSTSLTTAGHWDIYVQFAPTDQNETINWSVGAVPEPTTWAMMLVGVAGIGGALRRRNRAALAV
jgi:hypothetical protein